ncbi:MAG: UDP-N-acetylmuramoyl-L-alanine--D-glutamate ligase [Blastocatellia bacterium]
MELVGRHFVVVGMARSGLAAARFLHARGARVTVNDARPEAELAEAGQLRGIGLQVVGGGHPRELFESADCLVVSPGVPLAAPAFDWARRAGVEIIGEVELAARFLRGRVVGITGTNGKTTTTSLIGELLGKGGFPVLVGGNIGEPLVSLVDRSRDQDWIVAELSSFQLEAVEQLHVRVAVLLNITPDHLDRYDSMESYAAAKANILRRQESDDVAILNADDTRIVAMRALTPARIVLFSTIRPLDEGISLRGDWIVERRGGVERELIDRADIPLRGEHNLENVMAGLAAGLACGVDPDSMRRTIRSFRAVEHRLEFTAEIGGVGFYNDSKATNVDAAIKSLEAFPGGITVILGGKDKGSDFSPLRRLVTERCQQVILIGAAAAKIGEALANTRPLHQVESMEQAVRLGLQLSRPGDTVLLAPACASFDMFDNYEHRGRVFKEAVRRLLDENTVSQPSDRLD